MKKLTFPAEMNENGYVSLSLPERAKPCTCEEALLDDPDLCSFCGRFLRRVVDATWRERARELAT